MSQFLKKSVHVIVCGLPLALIACQSEKKAAAPSGPAPAVIVAPVTSKPVASSIGFVGQSEAFQKVELRARVTGFLNKQDFKEGSDLKKEALLFEIDPSEYIANRDAANAKVVRAEAALLQAEQSLVRYKKLVDKGTASVAKYDEAVAQEGQTKADVAAAKADLVRAELDLGYTKIISPISGRIGRSSVDVGNLIGPDSGVLATVVTLDPIHITFSISEREFLDYKKEVKEGRAEKLKPQIELANGETYPHDGTFDFLDNQVDADTGTIKARVSFPNPDSLILPGQFVTVSLVSSDPKKALVVPQAAVQQNQAGSFVLVVNKDSKVELRPIKTGQRTGTELVVSDGLTEGETIIVEGIQKVRPGAKVQPTQKSVKAN